jgi:V/A-type H+-transporting ATPase subunit C
VNDDYGYINARIRAMKSRLLDRPFFEKLMGEEQIHAIIAHLQATDYGKHIEEARALETSEIAAVEEGIRRRLTQTYAGVFTMVGGVPKRLLGIVLARWDVYNVKTVLRGKFSGASLEEVVKSFVPVCKLKEPLLKEMMKQPDIKAVVDLLITWNSEYYPPLRATLSDVFATNSLTNMEVALDKFYFERSLSFLKRGLEDESFRIVAAFLKTEIDILNILTLLKIVWNQIPPAESGELFIRDGLEIKGEDFLSAASSRDVDEIFAKFANTNYRELLDQAKQRFSQTGTLPGVERVFEQFMMERGAAMFRKSPLSIAPVIGYLWLKLCETMNLRAICRGKVAHLPQPVIQEGLIFV